MNFEQVSRLVTEKLSEKVISAERFPTGHQHFVFDVQTAGGKKMVVRISRPEHRHLARSAVFWNETLKPKGVPLPAILADDLAAEFPFLILERLPGMDLFRVYQSLSKSEKIKLAEEMARLQTIAAALPKAECFGYLETYESDSGCRSWFEFIQKHLDRSRRRITEKGFFDPVIVDRVESMARDYTDYFARIEPVAFFDDITTKNVIVDGGRLSGIVDVDRMCFGDRLLTVALTRTALLTDVCETDYIEFWCDALNIGILQRKVLNLYTAICCVDFIGEIGQTFNKDAPLAFDEQRVQRLFDILDEQLAKV